MRIASMKDDRDAETWDRFVTPRTGTVTDLFAWRRIIHAAYGMRSHFLGAFSGEELVGVLGLFEVKHPLLGHYLATAPFGNDGGLHGDSPEAIELLGVEARRLADELDVSYLVIRTRGKKLDGFISENRYRTAVINLADGLDCVWRKVLPAKTRNQVRRGQKEGFEISAGDHEISDFHEVLHRHMRDLGSPCHSLRFYHLIAKHLGDRASFIVVRDNAELVAGALLCRINGTAMNPHTVALKRYNRRCPNYLLHWDMIGRSCAAGCRVFDLGRSLEDSSNLKFKQNWNPQIVPLTFNYYLRKMKDIPFSDPRDSRYRLPIAVWRRLPLAVTKRVGPRLITGLV